MDAPSALDKSRIPFELTEPDSSSLVCLLETPCPSSRRRLAGKGSQRTLIRSAAGGDALGQLGKTDGCVCNCQGACRDGAQLGPRQRCGVRTANQELCDLHLSETLFEDAREGKLKGRKGVVGVHPEVYETIHNNLRVYITGECEARVGKTSR